MKIAWICETPYQLLNFLNYAWCRVNSEDEIDVYIANQFKDSIEIQNRIKEEHLCKNIYSYLPPVNRNFFSRLYHLIVAPEVQMKKMLTNLEDISQLSYDVLFISYNTLFARLFYLTVSSKHVYYFDDGSGSYHGDISKFSWRVLIPSLFLGRNLYKMKAEALFVNNPPFCKNEHIKDIRAFPPLKDENDEKWESIQRIFNYTGENRYREKALILLTQPSNERDIRKDFTDWEIINRLRVYNEQLIVRPHPRQTELEIDKYRGSFLIDNEQDMWELICADQITDEHILIGTFSTAQLNPKILFNKEPYILFLYELYPDSITKRKKREVQELIKRIAEAYSDPLKIRIAKSYDEIPEFINTSLRKNKRHS